MKKRVSSVILSATMLASAMLPVVGAGMASAEVTNTDLSATLPLQAWYDEPAEMNRLGWEQHATQLGNGFIGAMVHGGVATDKIQINEHTVWSGGPGASDAYDGGHTDLTEEERVAIRTEVQEALSKVSKAFKEYIEANPGYTGTKNYGDFFQEACGMSEQQVKDKVEKLFGEKNFFGSYQTLGDIYIADQQKNNNYTDYKRVLDLNNGTAKITYKQDGVTYTRDYFTNNPSNVMVIRLTASEKGKLSREISIDSLQPNKSIYGDIQNNTITMVGRPSDHGENGQKFAQQLKVVAEGGSVLTIGGTAYVDKADSITIYMTAGTNYIQQTDGSYDYFDDADPLDAVEARINAAVEKGYTALLKEHKEDYQALFNAMQLNVVDTTGITKVPSKPTDELLHEYQSNYRTGRTNNTDEENRYLENLYFQFGRYLLISCSREGSLPANLQGIWADQLNNAWSADYHLNINLQMNYWLAEQTNLGECHLPVVDFVSSLVPYGEKTAKEYYGADRGWVTHHENSIWGNTAPGTSGASYAPESAAWMCQDIWEHYLFTGDKEFLAEHYDTILGAALFWVETLVENEDGQLVASPSYSPEHGPYAEGATFVQAVVWEVFNEVVEGAKVLGKSNDAEVKEIAAAQAKLLQPTVETSIGSAGQFLEWQYETRLDNNEDKHHRHTNHLFGLHPGNQIVAGRSEAEDAMVEAMKVTLNNRGDGGSGWSKAWKVNFWARTRNGNRAYDVLSSLIGGYDLGGSGPSTADNLFDMHSPFQIDGNFGGTAGMAEMLLQSQGDAIELLPALPEAWASGVMTGMKARGNVEVDIAWNHNEPTKAVIRPALDNDALKVKGLNIANGTLTDSEGNEVEFTTSGNNTIVFEAKAGESYTITDIVDVEGLQAAKDDLADALKAAQAAYDSKKPTDELYDAAANQALLEVIDAGKALQSSNDKYVLLDAVDALSEAVDAFDKAYDLTLDVTLDSGIYSGVQIVELKNESNLVEIRYTLDGTAPTKDSALYFGPMALPFGVVKLNAATFYKGEQKGSVASREYLINSATNLAAGATAVETSTPSKEISGYSVGRIVNGNHTDRWATTSNASTDLVAEIDLKKNVTFSSYMLDEFCERNQADRVSSLKVEYWNGTAWVEIQGSVYEKDNVPNAANAVQHAYKTAMFDPITAQKLRLTMRGGEISIWAFCLYDNNAKGDKTDLNALIAECEAINLGEYKDTALFEAVLASAKNVKNNADATISDVAIAHQALLSAKDTLVPADQVLPGDVNLNGEVTAEDALMALQAATKKINLGEKETKAADVDGAANVTANDALMILQAATKKIELGGTKPSDPTKPSQPTKPVEPVVLPTATKDQLKAEMDEEVDPGRYTETTIEAYNQAMLTCQIVYDDPAMSGENIYRALVALRDAKADLVEKAQSNWVGTFSAMNGEYTVLNAGNNILYADWKNIDQGSINVADCRDDLCLQMTLRVQSENPNVDPKDIWNHLTIKLRSSDKAGVAGDTEAGNTEHNYGWDFTPGDFDGTATLKVSIPLSKAKANSRGVMDWTDVRRIIIQCFLDTNKATGDRYQYTLNVSGTRIVDMKPINEAKATLTEKVNAVKNASTAGVAADKVAAFNKALTAANDLLASTDPHISLYDVNKVLADLTAAHTALTA